MKRKRQSIDRSKVDNNKLMISLILLLALAIAPLFRGLYHEREFLLIGMIILGSCGAYLLKNRNRLQVDGLDCLFLFLCLCYLLSIWHAANMREAYIGLVKTVSYFSCYYLVRQFFQKSEDKVVVLKVLVFSITAITGLTLLTEIGIINIPSAVVSARFSGTLQYANTFAAMLMLAISLTYYLAQTVDPKQRVFYLIINYLNTLAFFAATSRGALLVYIPLMIFHLLIWRNRDSFFAKLVLINVAAFLTSVFVFKIAGWALTIIILLVVVSIYLLDKVLLKIPGKLQIIITCGVIIVGGCLALFLVQDSIISRITKIDLSSRGAVERFAFYKDALKIFSFSPLIGHGAEGWEYLYRAIQSYYYNTKLVHSNLFQLLVEIGLIGTLVYYSLFIIAGLKSIKAGFSEPKKMQIVLLGTLLAVQLHALIDFDLSMPAMSLMTFALLGLLAGEYRSGISGIMTRRSVNTAVILLVSISLVSTVSFFVAGVGVDGVISQVKGGKVQVSKIEQYQSNLRIAGFFDPLNSYYQDYLGQCVVAEGVEKNDDSIIREGLKKLDKAIQLSPYDYHLYIDKGKVLIQLDKYAEAADCFNQIIGLMPYHQAGYEYLIRTYTTLAFEKKDASYAEKSINIYQLAKENFNKIPPKYLSLIPEPDQLINSEVLNFQMGTACFLLGKYEEGLTHFETARSYIKDEKVLKEIQGWIAVGNKRQTGSATVDADPAMVQEIERLLADFS
jgi:O-antigen ligase